MIEIRPEDIVRLRYNPAVSGRVCEVDKDAAWIWRDIKKGESSYICCYMSVPIELLELAPGQEEEMWA